MPNLQIFQRGPTKSSQASQQIMQSLGQLSQTIAGVKQGEQAKAQQGNLAKLMFPDDQQKQDLFASLPQETQLKTYEAMQPKAAAGGPTAQPTPPDVSNKLSKILRENPKANAEELALLADEAGVPRIYSNSLIESRRQIQSDSTKQKTEDRKYQTAQAESVKENVSQLRSSLPRKRMALSMSRNSIESGEIGTFSLNNLSEKLGMPELRTAKGAQLITAGKENLLGNMSRVSARGQNQWFEQRLNSMFPQIGMSEAANETTQIMLEGEQKLDEAFLQAYDELSKSDKKEFGHVQGDIEDRIYQQIEPAEDQIMKEMGFKTRDVYEKEKGINYLKDHITEKVPRGTVLTPRMANLLKDKFGGDKQAARKAAIELGYELPSSEEVKAWVL